MQNTLMLIEIKYGRNIRRQIRLKLQFPGKNTFQGKRTILFYLVKFLAPNLPSICCGVLH